MHSFQSKKDTDGSINPYKHRFARGATDNLMDYTPESLTFDQLTVKDKKKDMLWKWQWDIMQ